MCPGCLDDLKCWVCLGQGLVDQGRGAIAPCPRCFGSGACSVCQPIKLGEVGKAPAVTVERRWWERRHNDRG